MIYFVQAVDGGPVKIGYSADVPLRVRQLEAHYRKPLAILATMPGGREQEAEIHARFDHLRFKSSARGRHPEQFRPAPDLMAFIGRPLLVSADPSAVEAMPTLAFVMPRPKVGTADAAIGLILAEHFIRLGYSETVIKTSEIAKLVSEKTGKSISRQRIANLLNAVRVNPETIEMIALGLGVTAKDLTRRSK